MYHSDGESPKPKHESQVSKEKEKFVLAPLSVGAPSCCKLVINFVCKFAHLEEGHNSHKSDLELVNVSYKFGSSVIHKWLITILSQCNQQISQCCWLLFTSRATLVSMTEFALDSLIFLTTLWTAHTVISSLIFLVNACWEMLLNYWTFSTLSHKHSIHKKGLFLQNFNCTFIQYIA